MNRLITIFLLILFYSEVSGQQNLPYSIWQNPSTDDFSTIQQQAEEYFKDRDQGRGSGYVQWKRWEWFNRSRLTPEGKITNVAARNLEEYTRYQQELERNASSDGSRSTTTGYWESLGISFFTNGAGWNPGIGRVNVIAFHPVQENIFWIGCPSGGLWKTNNGGATWIPLTDGMPRIGVSGIAIDYTNPSTIYILTGDGDAADTYSVGVLKTTNGGETWNSTGLSWLPTNFFQGYKLAMHPNDHNILFAVTSAGIYKTSDGGVTWSLEVAGWFFDLEFKPGTPSTIYACKASEFWISTNTGDTWSEVTAGVPTGCERMALTVSSANAAYVYILAGPATAAGEFKGVYRSTNSGTSFTLQADEPNLLGYSTTGQDAEHQTTYDLAVVASRTDASDVIAGGINCWKSLNNGVDWTCISLWNGYGGSIGYTHADIHDLAINPLNDWIYCCSDGGVFRSTDFGENWTDLSDGLEITQWYRIAGYEANSNLLIGGTQDEGSNKWTGGSTILHISGADGMDCMIDHSDPNIMYYSSQKGNLVKSTDGGASNFGIKPAGATGSWITPFLMDPVTPAIIYGGYDDVYKSTDGGASWTNKGVDGRDAMAIGINNPDRLYASRDCVTWMSNNGGNTWIDISTGLPSELVTFIAVNPDRSADVFVTLADYNAGQKVYQSADAGSTWTNISGTLPNIPVHCIAYEDCDGSPVDALYVGTDIGVFYRNSTMSDWIPFRNGLPTVPVTDLEINYTAGKIRAATYGRGIWESDLFDACPSAYTLTQANDPGNPNYTGFQYYEAGNSITSTRIITGGEGTDVTYKAGVKVELLQGFHARKGNRFEALLGPCEGTVSQPPARVVKGTFEGQWGQ